MRPYRQTARLSITGSRFKGLSEASGGNTRNSSTNYPLVQLRRVDNEAIRYLRPNASGWSDNQFVSVPLEEFQHGPALLTVFINGIPSESKIVLMGYTPMSTCIPYSARNDKQLLISF
jgi:large repetitive protein